MSRFASRLTTIAFVAMALVAAGCSDQIGDPNNLLAPDVAALGKGKKDDDKKDDKKDKKDEKDKKDKDDKQDKKDRKKGPKVKGKKKNGEEKELHAARRSRIADTRKVTMEVEPGDAAQSLEFAGHTLTVTGASVEKKTKFTLSEAHHFVDGEYVVALELKASAGRGQDNNVGEGGFLEPVRLCLAVSSVDEFDYDAEEYDLIWFKSNGDEVEAVDGTLQGDQVCGDLDHFSMWGLAWP